MGTCVQPGKAKEATKSRTRGTGSHTLSTTPSNEKLHRAEEEKRVWEATQPDSVTMGMFLGAWHETSVTLTKREQSCIPVTMGRYGDCEPGGTQTHRLRACFSPCFSNPALQQIFKAARAGLIKRLGRYTVCKACNVCSLCNACHICNAYSACNVCNVCNIYNVYNVCHVCNVCKIYNASYACNV